MKRPEGFDQRQVAPEAAEPKGLLHRLTRDRGGAPRVATPSTQDAAAGDVPAPAPIGARPERDEPDPAAAERRAARDLAKAERRRHRDERAEVRRFTRRTRRRKLSWLAALLIVAILGGLVAVAVYSPLLALREIRVDGTSRVDPAQITAAIDGQLGTPLALLDSDRLTEELGDFPLIRSYTTETIPPDTLVIHVVERAPIGSVQLGDAYALVDPAGIVIERSAERMAGVPLIDTGGAGTEGVAFSAAVEVLLAVPDSVLGQLDTITARTRDDVSLTLVGGGGAIVWGGADQSDLKARVLAAMLAQNLPNVSEYNVSAPSQPTYR